MSSTASSRLQDPGRKQRITSALTQMLAKLFGKNAAELDVNASMIDLGGDSLFFLQASNAIRENFNIKIPFRLLLEELSTIDSLADHLDQKLTPDAVAGIAESSSSPIQVQSLAAELALSPVVPVAQEQVVSQRIKQSIVAQQMDAGSQATNANAEGDPIYQIFAQQLALMSQQIAILTGQPNTSAQHLRSPQPSLGSGVQPSLPLLALAQAQLSPVGAASSRDEVNLRSSSEIEPEVYVPYEAIQPEAAKSLTEQQRKYLAGLIERINRCTGESKRITQEYRKYHADNRTAAGFRMPWKEMFYPLVVERGQGSHIWDVDGNEYIDMTMGFGALLFGHSPKFIMDTLAKQLDLGIRLGPHSREAGEAAHLICEMTGVDRVAFCNSGTEAIMTALRLARTVTGRSKIALFEGCYHGTFDGILVKGERKPDGSLQAIPLAPGVPGHMIENVLMLKYDDPQSLEILRARAGELAAILIEPPRSRRPDVQPREFLLELRRISETSGAALIFDEVVTGFRFHPGGAQALFGIRADLVTYGKALGGGLPVAAVAGKSKFMDAVDGGMWQYGDGSYPESEITFSTGTYFKHPLIMPAVVAALKYIKESGFQLQESLNAKAKYAADELDAFFKAKAFPLRVAQIGSLFRLLHGPELRYMDLFYYHLLEKGIYVCETHNCLVSTAHSDSDMEVMIRAAKESLLEMREEGFLPATSLTSTGSPAHRANGTGPTGTSTPIRVPLTEAQRQIWAVSHMGEGDSRAYNLPLAVQWRGELDVPLLRKVINHVVERHEAFRATFSSDGDFQTISPTTIEVPLVDLSGLKPEEQQAQAEQWRTLDATRVFDFVSGPLLSLRLLKFKSDLHTLLITMHHIISDGWSLGMFINEMQQIYCAELGGTSLELAPPKSFAEYATHKAQQESQLANSEAERFWLTEFPNSIPPQRLPADALGQGESGILGTQKRLVMTSTAMTELKEISRRYSCTSFMVFLAVCKIFIYYLTKQEEVVIGVPTAGQSLPDGGYLAGCCVNLLAFRTHMNAELSFPQLVVMLRQKLVKAYEHEDYPFNLLLKRLRTMHPQRPEPAISVIFNLDRAQTKKKREDFDLTVMTNHNQTSKFDLTVDVTETQDSLIIDFEYKSNLFTSERITCWMGLFEKLIQEISKRPAQTIRDYFAVLQEEEARQNALAAQELNRQEYQRFAASRRKVVAS